MTTPSFFDDLAEKCAKTKFDAENKRRVEQASFKCLLTELWEKQKPSLAETAVKNGDHSLTAIFCIGKLKFKAYKPDIYAFRDHLPTELAQATKCQNAEKGHVYEVVGRALEERPVYACKVVFQHATDAHLKEWRSKRDEEDEVEEMMAAVEAAEAAAKKPKLEPNPEPKPEPKVKEEPA